MTPIAALPMYNVTPRHAALWKSLALEALHAMRIDAQWISETPDDLMSLWRRDDLLLSQTCGYPYRMRGLREHVRLIATPSFDAPGCEGACYRSAFVVSSRAHSRGATTLAACRGLRAAYNDDHSHSGMNALRHAIAPLARESRFFSAALRTGSHAASLRALSEDEADIAAIDCVTFAYLNDAMPQSTRDAIVIGYSEEAPGLPLIGAASLVDEAKAHALRDALNDALASDAARARVLRLTNFTNIEDDAYACIERFELDARTRGHARLG